MTDRYTALFDRLSGAGTAALIPYLVIGDPTPEDFLDLVDVLVENGADALELGIAFSDPLADGPTIQRATQRALRSGVVPNRALALVARVRHRHPDLPIGLLAYANIVLNTADFAAKCIAAEVDSILIPDVPVEMDVLLGLDATPLQRVYILPPNADERLTKAVAHASEGYVYVTSRAGVTGASDTISAQIGRHLPVLAANGAPPAVLGFGISRGDQVRVACAAGFDGVIIGSALVQRVADNLHDRAGMRSAAAEIMREMKPATVRRSA